MLRESQPHLFPFAQQEPAFPKATLTVGINLSQGPWPAAPQKPPQGELAPSERYKSPGRANSLRAIQIPRESTPQGILPMVAGRATKCTHTHARTPHAHTHTHTQLGSRHSAIKKPLWPRPRAHAAPLTK